MMSYCDRQQLLFFASRNVGYIGDLLGLLHPKGLSKLAR